MAERQDFRRPRQPAAGPSITSWTSAASSASSGGLVVAVTLVVMGLMWGVAAFSRARSRERIPRRPLSPRRGRRACLPRRTCSRIPRPTSRPSAPPRRPSSRRGPGSTGRKPSRACPSNALSRSSPRAACPRRRPCRRPRPRPRPLHERHGPSRPSRAPLLSRRPPRRLGSSRLSAAGRPAAAAPDQGRRLRPEARRGDPARSRLPRRGGRDRPPLEVLREAPRRPVPRLLQLPDALRHDDRRPRAQRARPAIRAGDRLRDPLRELRPARDRRDGVREEAHGHDAVRPAERRRRAGIS